MAYANASKFTRGYTKTTHQISSPLVEFKVRPSLYPMIVNRYFTILEMIADKIVKISYNLDLMQVVSWLSLIMREDHLIIR